MAVPTLIIVAPSASAISKSPDMPIESSGSDSPLLVSMASLSSRRPPKILWRSPSEAPNGATVMKGTKDVFKSDFEAAKKADLSSSSAYEKFIEKVDPDAFIDYIICRQFLLDTDTFNQKYWRTVDYGIRWRPILYDLDLIFDSAASRNIAYLYFNKSGTAAAHGSITYFYFSVALKTNAEWRQRFIERYVELVMTQFSEDRLNALLDQMVAELEPEMSRHIARWGHPKSVSAWKSDVETLRKKFTQRPAYALEHMRKEFNLSNAELDALIAKYR